MPGGMAVSGVDERRAGRQLALIGEALRAEGRADAELSAAGRLGEAIHAGAGDPRPRRHRLFHLGGRRRRPRTGTDPARLRRSGGTSAGVAARLRPGRAGEQLHPDRPGPFPDRGSPVRRPGDAQTFLSAGRPRQRGDVGGQYVQQAAHAHSGPRVISSSQRKWPGRSPGGTAHRPLLPDRARRRPPVSFGGRRPTAGAGGRQCAPAPWRWAGRSAAGSMGAVTSSLSRPWPLPRWLKTRLSRTAATQPVEMPESRMIFAVSGKAW